MAAAAAQQHLSGGDSLILQEIRNGNQALSTTLGQEHFTEPLIIERAHRAFGPRPSADQRARPVLIRLLKCQDRDKILRIAAQRSRENKGPIKYDDKPVLFFTDLSASLVKRRKEYDRVKTELRSRDILFALLHPATLRITLPEGGRRFFQTPKEAAAFLQQDLNGNNRCLKISRATVVPTSCCVFMFKL
ncbi:hypothetical protein KUCAC02_006186 [Chaenocephalus aceratus]|nr:hypothetical protein KUCAC02_006186 [Chaenocephalus aceratus]